MIASPAADPEQLYQSVITSGWRRRARRPYVIDHWKQSHGGQISSPYSYVWVTSVCSRQESFDDRLSTVHVCLIVVVLLNFFLDKVWIVELKKLFGWGTKRSRFLWESLRFIWEVRNLWGDRSTAKNSMTNECAYRPGCISPAQWWMLKLWVA